MHPKRITIMKNIFFAAICAALTFSACDTTPKLSVEGCIGQAADSMLYLAHCSLEGIENVDSAKLDESGRFSFTTTAPSGSPEFYVVYSGRHVINFCADTTGTITIKADLPNMESDYNISGNEASKQIKEISLMQQRVQAKLMKIETNMDMLPGDMADSVENVIEQYKEALTTGYIYKDPASAAAYYAVCQNIIDARGIFKLFDPLTDRKDVKRYAAVATAWDANYPDAPRTKQLCNMAIKGMDNTASPTQKVVEVDESKIAETGIIDISLPDVNSRIRSIQDLKGKVVLIDFTVYGAKQSAERIRLMRTLYEKYHNEGFEIYQISLDEDIHFWKYSCDKLPWICVHETDGSATNVYGVSTLPTFFLVNRDNEIVARSDFMEGSLEANIQKLL